MKQPSLTDRQIWQVSKTEKLLEFGGIRVNKKTEHKSEHNSF